MNIITMITNKYYKSGISLKKIWQHLTIRRKICEYHVPKSRQISQYSESFSSIKDC